MNDGGIPGPIAKGIRTERGPACLPLAMLRWSLALLPPVQSMLPRHQTLATSSVVGAVSLGKLVALVVIICALWYVRHRPRVAVELRLYALPACLYVLAIVAGTAMHAHVGESAAFVITMLSFVPLTMACAVWARSDVCWQPMVLGLAAAACITGLTMVYQVASGGGPLEGARAEGMGRGANTSNIPILVALPVLAAAAQSGGIGRRAALAAAYLAGWAGVAVTLSRSAGIAAVLGAILGIRRHRDMVIIALLAAALWGATQIGYRNPLLTMDAEYIERRGGEFGGRDRIWSEVLEAVAEHPYGSSASAHKRLPHSNLQKSLITLGVPGASLYLALAIPLFAGIRQARRRQMSREDSAVARSWLVCLASVEVYSEIGGVTLDSPWFWIAYGVCLGLSARRVAPSL